MHRRLLFLINSPNFFLSHRLPLAIAARDNSYDVHVATSDGEAVAEIERMGFPHHKIAISRSGKNFFHEIISILTIWHLFYVLRPSIVHLVTIKPVLYGGLAARITGLPAMVAAISGLGSLFTHDGQKKLLSCLVATLYRIVLEHPNCRIIFQNPDDQMVLSRLGAIRHNQARMIRGSGVDLQAYPYLPEPKETPVVTMAARLLCEKGVKEFINAARLLHERGISVKFQLCGEPDPGNPGSVTHEQLTIWNEHNHVCVLGHQHNIAKQYIKSNIVCLPSYYREGLPKTLMEAAACGRAVITTDSPGCRDAIVPQKTGILVPPRNEIALADAIQKLIDNKPLRQAMGKAGRKLAEKEFGVDKIISEHLAIYHELEQRHD